MVMKFTFDIFYLSNACFSPPFHTISSESSCKPISSNVGHLLSWSTSSTDGVRQVLSIKYTMKNAKLH